MITPPSTTERSREEEAEDDRRMARALELAATVRTRTSPNPWVGCVLVAPDGRVFEGATEPPGGPHAEAVVLRQAGEAARGATAYVTLEPCAHQGRTPPCADALLAAGVARVVVALGDPDSRVAGAGVLRLREGGVTVSTGLRGSEARVQLAPYLKQRSTGRPYVVLKLAATLDGRIADPAGGSTWISGEEARRDAHQLRAESDAILIGAGTVRSDDPELTVRAVEGRDPLRVVLGAIPEGAKVLPALEESGELPAVLDRLGERGVLQVLVEGGSRVAHDFHASGLVDRYVFYLAPALFGGDNARPMFEGPGAETMAEIFRGEIVSVTRLGPDLRVDLAPRPMGKGG